jgi:acetyl esterase/lipase
MPRTPILVPLLCVMTLLLAAAAAAGAQPATPTAPTPPTQPATGPGGMDYAYDRVVFTEHGEGAGGYLLFEPADPHGGGTPTATAPLPIVLFLSACCETDDLNDVTDNGAPWRAWIDHLVRRGAVVVFPRFDPRDPMTGVTAAVGSALAELEGSGHPLTDPTRLVTVGHSFGAALAVQYAAIAADRGLPVPIALMPAAPSWGNLPSDLGDTATVPATTRLLVVVAEDDDQAMGREIWAGLAQIPADRKDFVVVRTDSHGSPPLVADHPMPATDVFGTLDALDWYGTWKLLDALMACSFDGTWCKYALGNTPEQRFMGVWSDGVAVIELNVSDDPGAP